MSTSSGMGSSSSIPIRVSWAPICIYGILMDIRTSEDGANLGRRYFCCQVRKWDDCDFFQWIDELEATLYCQNYYAHRLTLLEEKYESQLQSKAVAESLLSEELRLKTEECELIKLKVEKLKKKSNEFEYVRTRLEEAIIGSANHEKWNWVVFVLSCGLGFYLALLQL